MIIISDCSKNIVIPAGLGDNAGVVYETAGVKSLNGETGDLKIKTVNGNDMLGEGNIEIKGGVETVNGQTGDVKIKTVNGQSLIGESDVPVDVGVETLNGQKGALTLKTVNGNELTGDGNIEIQAGLKYFELSEASRKEAYDEIANHWDDNSGYTGDCIFYYRRERGVYTFSEIGYLKDHSVWFNYLNNAGAYGIGDGKVKCFAIIIWYENGNPSWSTYEDDRTIPTKVSELTNDSEFQTKAEVDTAIENAVSGGGSTGSDIINLDSLTQEEKKGLYDKFEAGKNPDVIFLHGDTSSFRAFWQDGNIAFDTFSMAYQGLRIRRYEIEHDGNVYEYEEPFTWNNLLLLSVEQHTAEGADFECGYSGDFYDYMGRNNTRPNSYFILYNNGIGDSAKPVFAPVSVIWDNNNFDGNTPIRIQFTVNEKLYTYLHGDTNGKWLFESAKPIGGVQSSEVSNIKVLTQAEYDTLIPKDDNVLYCIKG